MRLPRLLAPLLLAASLIHATGCRGTPDPVVARDKVELEEVYQIYQHFVKSQEKAPAELSDLVQTRYEALYPATIRSLENGKIVVIWNITSKDHSTLLAHAKDVAEKGGMVLTADGTVKAMTAAEFAAAKRAP